MRRAAEAKARAAEEAAAKERAEEEAAAKKKAEEEEAAAKKKAEEEEAVAKKKAEEEEAAAQRVHNIDIPEPLAGGVLLEETCAVPVADLHQLLFVRAPSPVFSIYHERRGNTDVR